MRFPTLQFRLQSFSPLLATLLLATAPAAAQEGAQVLWRFEIPSSVPGQHIGVGADGRVYTTSFTPPNLYALTPQGSLLWTLAIGESGYWPISFANDGTIYTGAAAGVRAVNPDGTLRWASDLGSWSTAGPTVGPDGNLYAAADGVGFFSLDPNGDQRWSSAGDPAASGLYLDADNIVFGSDRLFSGIRFLRSGPWISTYAFDLNGAQLWFRQIAGLDGGPSSNPRQLPDGRLTFRWGQGSLAAVRQDATADWIVPHPDGAQMLVTPAVGPDGTIYAGDQYGVQLWSVNPDGTTHWVRPYFADDHLAAVGLGVSPDNRVLIASGWTWSSSEAVNHGWIRGYDPANGELLWQIDLTLEQNLSQIPRTVTPAFSPSGDTAYLTTSFVGSGVGHSYLYAIALRPTTTGVPTDGVEGPRGPLVSISPNPVFGPATILLRAMSQRAVSVVIYDAAGREIRHLFEGFMAAPELSLEWDLHDAHQRVVDSGIYFVNARTPDGTTTMRVVVAR